MLVRALALNASALAFLHRAAPCVAHKTTHPIVLCLQRCQLVCKRLPVSRRLRCLLLRLVQAQGGGMGTAAGIIPLLVGPREGVLQMPPGSSLHLPVP